ncbi:MAG: hypothetical protein H6730_20390 [Deltaproteobacteria bacterium]|nr:hypothetical protein [Deltaproteobacteria bacterium]
MKRYFAVALVLCLQGAGCSSEPTVCVGDSECQDGNFCNGWEQCDPSSVRASARGCVPGIACLFVRNEFRFEEGPDAAASVACAEDVYGLGIYRRCAEREGKPRPSKGSALGGEFCEAPLEVDYQIQCRVEAYNFCYADADCDNGNFCDGVERCVPMTSQADAFGCAPAAAGPCAAPLACDEVLDTCFLDCVDEDGDGAMSAACGGDDCDDADPGRFPGNPEVCNDRDEDCDDTTLGDVDEDGDGFVSAACRGPGGRQGSDCDDTNPHLFPGSIRCAGTTPNDQGNIQVCTAGVWSNSSCENGWFCYTQPPGYGVCVP